MRIGLRRSIGLTAGIIVGTVVLGTVATPPIAAALACIVVGVLAGAVSALLSFARAWLPYIASLIAVIGANFIGARWGVAQEMSLVSLIGVAVSARLLSDLLIRYGQRTNAVGFDN
jgi:hypothetical protein